MSAQTKTRRQSHKTGNWGIFDRVNYRFFLAGIVVIVLGFIAMMQGPWNSFLSLHLAPILLIIGYCVLIPIAILKRSGKPKGD
jgi:hypothetical protein